jgi:ankyrin repeat protein
LTPLFLALAGGEREAARILLDAGGPPSLASSTGMTALAAAAGAGDAGIVKDLLERITRESPDPDVSLALP